MDIEQEDFPHLAASNTGGELLSVKQSEFSDSSTTEYYRSVHNQNTEEETLKNVIVMKDFHSHRNSELFTE